ncbi:hypothetical protein ACFWQD_03420 [Alcaligenes faecalis]|uniref:hypothetical protein n=1 Tax=Alcaligenes faecalis TaxID=511 RepID=UPI003669E6B5
MKLSDLYISLSREGRLILAEKAGVNAGYLWQIATKWRDRKPSVDVMARLVRADSRLTAADLLDEFSEPFTKEPHMPNTPDPKPDDRIPIGPPDCITKGGAHA